MDNEQMQKNQRKKGIKIAVGVCAFIVVYFSALIGYNKYLDYKDEQDALRMAEQDKLRAEQLELKQQEALLQKVAAEWTDAGITFDENGNQKTLPDETVKQVLNEDDDIVNAAANAETEPKSEEKNTQTEAKPEDSVVPEQPAELPPVELFTEVNETVYATSTVNVRGYYNTSGEKLGSLSYGDSVTRTGIGKGDAANWSRVDFNGKTAYVNSKYLSTEKPAEVEKTVKVETSANTNATPKDGDMKTVDGKEYCYLEGFGWVEYSPGGTGITADFELSGNIVGY